MPNVELRAFRPEHDLSIIESWLAHPDVSRWWGEPAHALEEIVSHPTGAAALIVVDMNPIGYLCWQSPTRAELDDAGLGDLPDDLIDVDIMIGEPTMTGRGFGPAALQLLFDRLRVLGISLVGLATAISNQRALRAFAKAGLEPYRDFQEMGEDYRYFTRQLDNSDPPVAPEGR